MDRIERVPKTRLDAGSSRCSFSVHRDIQRSRTFSTDHNRTHNRNQFGYRNYISVPAVVLSVFTLLPQLAQANGDVGGVSATANPVATSSGSVTNQAIQVLQGPYITNTYGNGIQCQGPTLNLTPFVTRSHSYSLPYEDYFDTPVYSTIDADDDGIIDNPDSILYHIPTRTGQKDSHNLNGGLSATLSIPLDFGLQRRCKEAADANIAHMRQLTSNKRLDFELARLKNCGELKLRGIRFHPNSPYFSICSDVVVTKPPGSLPQHRHSIPAATSSKNAVQPVSGS